MAFGFFKKSEFADSIFTGGKIFTQNTDLPWAEAVACKDGRIIAVGDAAEIASLEGKHTNVIELSGNYLFPGFIDTCGHPVLNAFEESCLYLFSLSMDEILAEVSTYAKENSERTVIFAYGADDKLLRSYTREEGTALLDHLEFDRPTFILGESGLSCIINTKALDLIKAAAEEDEMTAVSLLYMLHVLEPIDLDEMPESLPKQMVSYGEKGFTSVFDCGAPEFFASIYQNMLVHLFQEQMIKQRFFGSLLIMNDVTPISVMRKISQYKTTCTELEQLVNFNGLKLVIKRNQNNEMEYEENRDSLLFETIKELCIEAGDKGFDVHIDAIGKAAALDAVEAFGAARSSGYRKNAFILAHDNQLDQKDLRDTNFQVDCTESPLTYGRRNEDWICIENTASVEEAINQLTIDGAMQLGLSHLIGSIEVGKFADFAVFEENPLALPSIHNLKNLQSVMTIIAGKIVYDAEEDDLSNWYAMLSSQQY